MWAPNYDFLSIAGRILNSGQARTLVLTGAINDLFFVPGDVGGGNYVPLVTFLTENWNLPNRILIVYELNGPIRFLNDTDRDKLKDAWLKLRTGLDANQLAIERMLQGAAAKSTMEALNVSFDTNLERAVGRPTLALEMLRQMCLCSRNEIAGESLLQEDLIIIIEAADMLIPEAPVVQLSDADRHRVAICQDWLSDPGFANGNDAVILLSESRSQLNHRISQLPQVLEVQAQSANRDVRRHFIEWFEQAQSVENKLKLETNRDKFIELTAGLSIHALSQLLKGASHEGKILTDDQVVIKVEEYIKSQLGEDIVEFKKPSHTLADVVGFEQLKTFLQTELIPRFRATGPHALPGAAVCGPIGSGKTYIFEAVAAELGMVVLTLKNIRSQWFGQTDVIFERLRRVLEDLSKVLIFVDEADTQFGGVSQNAHPTERRLTGKIQAMMSDTRLRGRVIWLLMTARIHLLSPDIRRPGRTGDLIIPVLDPEGKDREEFIRWAVKSVITGETKQEDLNRIQELTVGYSAASFAALRSELIAKANNDPITMDRIVEIIHDLIPPAIGDTRRYQTLQALVNCTRRSLLPDPNINEEQRIAWQDEIRQLQQRGIG
jgi:ATP-dependent 26S proteasome regulatory subunit